MRYLLSLSLFVVCFHPSAMAQTTLLPAGTLLHCTMDEPNFSTKTAEVGDPVICHLNQITEFGHSAFPRGTYLAGHLEADKQPGHFVGKGYLNITFDRIGLPDMDADLSAKIIAAQGQHVDAHGRIIGHGHAKRDAAEWMLPPLWPWKVMMLPARGPQTKLKDEQELTLLLKQDVEIPHVTTYSRNTSPWRHFGGADAAGKPSPSSYTLPPPGASTEPASESTLRQVYYASPITPAMDPPDNSALNGVSARVSPPPVSARVTLLALKSETIYPATDYWVANKLLVFILPDGTAHTTAVDYIDWQRTTDLNAERGVRVSLRTKSTQF